MRNAPSLAFFAFFVASIASVHVAQAADAGAVLSACDRTAGCDYKQNKAGDVSGCSKQACFYCPADGKHQCFGVGARAGKGAGKGVAGNVGGVKVEALQTKQGAGKGSGVTSGTSATNAKSGGKVTRKNVSNATTTNPQTQGPAGRRHEGGGKR